MNQSALVVVKDRTILYGFESASDGFEWETENPIHMIAHYHTAHLHSALTPRS